MIVSLGKCAIEETASVDGAPAAQATWKRLKTPKDGTTKLTQNAGTTTDVLEEGGDVIDTRTGKPTAQIEWDEFVKKGEQDDFADDDGIVAGEHALRIYPVEDDSCPGIQVDRSTITVTESFATADGILRHHVARVLKPKAGKMVKRYTHNAGA